MSIEVFLINEAFVASFLLAFGVWGPLVFLERVEMFEELGRLGSAGIVKGDVNVESTWSLESIIESVGMIGRCKENRVLLGPVSHENY
jgi:hypothetical protein